MLIEGPDGSGKSTLFDQMTRVWGLRSSGHDGGPPVDAADVWKRLAHFAVMAPSVRDRSPCVSDVVYSRVLGREMRIPEEDSRMFLRALDPVLLYCSPPPDAAPLLEVRAHKPAEFVDKIRGRRMDIYQAYQDVVGDLCRDLELDLFVYDWTKDPSARSVWNFLVESGACAA